MKYFQKIFNATTLILLLAISQSNSQVSTPFNFGGGGNYVGWDVSMGITLPIRTTNANDIDLETNSIVRMRIMGNNGFVGIGANLLGYTPGLNLDVQNQINVNFNGVTPINLLGIGYYIGGNIILQTPGTNNTFLGNNVGSSWTTGQDNSLFGQNAGSSLTSGGFNTFLGTNSGAGHDVQSFNTYVGNLSGTNNSGASNSFFGHHAGFNTAAGNFNTFLGEHAGFGSVTNLPFGDNNTFVGHNAGQAYFTATDNTIVGAWAGDQLFSGNENAFLGNLAGRFNNTGSHNTFIGFRSGQNNLDGSDNTLVGFQTFVQPVPSISNSTAIGARASVVTNNTLILGDNNVNVGIGLSGNGLGPGNKLEINDNVNGGSGLRFRQLTSASPTVTSNNLVLTVDDDGDVVLTDDVGAGPGNVAACNALLPTDIGYIPRWTSTGPGLYELCGSVIFDDGIGHVGVSTTNPIYRFHNFGDALFAKTTVSSLLATYNTGTYPMSVLSNNNSKGIGLFSEGTYSHPNGNLAKDELNIYVDNTGHTFFRNLSLPAYFTTSYYSRDYMGFSPASASVVISGDFSTIGTVPADIKNSKLYVDISVANKVSGSVMNNAIMCDNLNDQNGHEQRGIFSRCTFPRQTGGSNIGGRFAADGSLTANNAGIWVTAQSVTGSPSTNTNNYGGYFEASGNRHNFAVFGRTPIGICLNNFCTAAAGFFAGDVYTTSAVYYTSDSALKENILPMEDATSIISQLQPKSYNYIFQQLDNMVLPHGIQYGLVAQEVEAVLPGLVNDVTYPATIDSVGNVLIPEVNYKGMNYTGLIPFLVQGFKEQKSILDSLTIQVILLKQTIDYINNNSDTGIINQRSSITLENVPAIILNQNSPNPFKDKTEITYSIPESVTKAVILFYDQSGKILNEYVINHKGEGALLVYGDNLSSGIYTYSLIIDGEPIKTKRMMKD